MKRKILFYNIGLLLLVFLLYGCQSFYFDERRVYLQIFVDMEDYFVEARLDGWEFSPLFAPYEVGLVYDNRLELGDDSESFREVFDVVKDYFSNRQFYARLWKVASSHYVNEDGKNVLKADDVFLERVISVSVGDLLKNNKLMVIIGERDIYLVVTLTAVLEDV